MNTPIKILVADDHFVVRIGLESLLSTEADLEIVGMAADGAEALSMAEHLQPDVLILDLMMPKLNGCEVVRRLREAESAVKIIILTTYGSSDILRQAIDNGAMGALLKNSTETELVKAVRAVAKGKRYISNEIAAQLACAPAIPTLTDRQLQVIDCLCRGLSNSDIATLNGCSETAVKKLLQSTFAKLGVATRTEAVALALRRHLLGNETI